MGSASRLSVSSVGVTAVLLGVAVDGGWGGSFRSVSR